MSFHQIRSRKRAKYIQISYLIVLHIIRIRDLVFHYRKILLVWLLFSGESVEIHSALSVHRYMACANDINNTESQ